MRANICVRVIQVITLDTKKYYIKSTFKITIKLTLFSSINLCTPAKLIFYYLKSMFLNSFKMCSSSKSNNVNTCTYKVCSDVTANPTKSYDCYSPIFTSSYFLHSHCRELSCKIQPCLLNLQSLSNVWYFWNRWRVQ